MAPRKRHDLDPRSDDYGTRWAIHLRKLVDQRRLSPAEFREQLKVEGLEISHQTIEAWLRGRRLPRVGDLERIARVLGTTDYRKILPPPRR